MRIHIRVQKGVNMSTKGLKTHHVVPNPAGGWNVKRGGSDHTIKRFIRKQAAIDYARKIAKNQKTELKIHSKDGKIAQSISYGNDPYPPAG